MDGPHDENSCVSLTGTFVLLLRCNMMYVAAHKSDAA